MSESPPSKSSSGMTALSALGYAGLWRRCYALHSKRVLNAVDELPGLAIEVRQIKRRLIDFVDRSPTKSLVFPSHRCAILRQRYPLSAVKIQLVIVNIRRV